MTRYVVLIFTQFHSNKLKVGKGDMFEHVLLSHPVDESFSVQVVTFATPLTIGEFEVDYIQGMGFHENNRLVKKEKKISIPRKKWKQSI